MNRTNLIAGAVAVAVMLVAIAAFGLGDNSDEMVVGVPSAERPAAQSPPAQSPPAQSPAPESPAAESPPTQSPTAEAEQPAPVAEDSVEPFSDLPTIRPVDLPPEAIDTLVLIADGGPYPYRQDDEVFQNREAILPDRELGHYREYTVDTPGSDDRGARRIVTGADGELYYTDDHYDSFREIIP